MKWIFALVFGALMAQAYVAYGDECMTPDEVRSGFRQIKPDIVFVEFSEQTALRFLRKFNAMEPVTNYTADHIMAIEGPYAAVVYLFEGNCLVEIGSINPEIYIQMLGDPT